MSKSAEALPCSTEGLAAEGEPWSLLLWSSQTSRVIDQRAADWFRLTKGPSENTEEGGVYVVVVVVCV